MSDLANRQGFLSLTPESKIFIACPARVASGGPESLHQLSDALRGLGIDARMVYYPFDADATPSDYASYRVMPSSSVEDCPGNLVVVPEQWTFRLRYFGQIQKAVWWLSVDNHFKPNNRPLNFADPANGTVCHLAGTVYAREFVRSRGAAHVALLCSYINAEFQETDWKQSPRQDAILYNPIRASLVTARLMAATPGLTWQPIENLRREGVRQLLSRHKLYVDFGHFPGKERLHREAALSGCCVITGRKGAAAYDEDVRVPSAYKFDDRGDEVSSDALEKIVATMRRCLDKYDDVIDDFAAYRLATMGEKAEFLRHVDQLFGRARRDD